MDDHASKDLKSIEVDFGEVEVGVTKIKSIKIVNNSCNEQIYVVQRDFLSNPLDCVFNTIDYTWSLMPCESYICDISYRPILPNRRYTDYFFITDACNCCYKIVVRGSSPAVNVTSSCTRLIIACDKNGSANKCVKLTNDAKIPAKFTFDVDNDQCPFKISEPSGIVKPLSSKSIEISFQPISSGIYKYDMPCLILHQNPIIFELYGLCDLDKRDMRSFFTIVDSVPELDRAKSFANYMSDTTAIVKDEPPTVSLSRCFVDFEEAEVGPENSTNRTPQAVCLTNNSRFDILVLWEKDKSNVFGIHPQEARVGGYQSIIFEARFDPLDRCQFHSRELLARVFRVPCCTSNIDKLTMEVIPQFVSIRLIGHTYGNGTNDWMPQYEIPETMTMPACVPALPVYGTFLMRNFGQQPLMFHFIPPSVTHFSIKPVMGLITHEQEYQVIVVELFPEACADPAYVERWAVRLNGNSKSEIYLDLQGYAEQGNLVFGDENTVVFDPVYLGCKQTRAVCVRNLSRHIVRFEYSADLPKQLFVEPMTGLVQPNEMVLHDWTFVPDQLNCYEFDVSCRLTTDIVGARCCVASIEASASSTEGSLMAMPEELNFGRRVYDETSEMNFRIFNFSPVKIHYRLTCCPLKSLDTMENPERDATISPSRGNIDPGKCEQVQVVLNPKRLGFYELTIQYTVISNASADDGLLLPLTDSKSLCRVTCMCYLPALEVKDLLYRVDAMVGVSKVSLWKSLCIDGLNAAMKETQPREERVIDMRVPPIGPNETLTVKLLLINPSPIDISCSFKKKKACFCHETAVKCQLPLTRKNSKSCCTGCVDDQAIDICPKKMKLMPNETCILMINIKNSPLHPSGVYWDFHIGNERCITLNINFECSFILPEPRLDFRTVDLKESLSMRYQAIWLYNNSENDVPYVIKTKALAHLNKRNYAIIFTCLNPQGTVKRWERIPVLFGFCPNKYGKFETRLPVKLDDKEATLTILAECTSTLKTISEGESCCPRRDAFKAPDVIAYFNCDYLTTPPISTHGTISRIIMLHNHHRHNVFSYKWKNYEIAQVVKVNVEPTSGLIQPQSLLTFFVHVHSYFYECLLDVDVHCHFVDMTEKGLAERKRREQECILMGMDGEFTIDERGLSYPRKPAFDPIKEPSTFWKALTLKIDVRDFYSANRNVDVERQLKSVPAVEETHERVSNKKLAIDLVQLSSSIIENIVWEIVNNECFFKLAEENLMKAHKLRYSRLPMCFKNENKHLKTKRLDWIPSKKLTNDILRNMINMITHEEFNFDTSHFSQPPDVRQISYKKICMEAFYKQASEPSINFEALE